MDQRNRSGLEVTCIGSLYQGPWEKKYWSSSRGKDRYPYPVGYQAVRCNNGETYQMEVQEGVRGPLFMVSFGEGITCSGDTPTIAWQKAMRKRNARSKKAQHRLLIANSNGSELFGFLNPLVQRLLRELVSSKGGSVHRIDEPEKSSKHIIGKVDEDKIAVENNETKTLQARLSWGTSKSLLVRKSRTSIVNSRNEKHRTDSLDSVPQEGTKEPDSCRMVAKQTRSLLPMQDEEDLYHLEGNCIPRYYRKRLKLPEEAETTEIPSQNNGVFRCTWPVPDDIPPVLLLDQAFAEHTVMVSDIPEEQPSQFFKEKLLKTSEPCVTDTAASESQQKDLSTSIGDEEKLQLANAVILDSCDIDSVLTPLQCAKKSTDPVIDSSLERQKGTTSYEGVSTSLERSLEQTLSESGEGPSGSIPVDTCKCSSHCSTTQNSQYSDDNMENCESDSLGQELTKSMITLLLPQALEFLGKKKRRKAKSVVPALIASDHVKEVIKTDKVSDSKKIPMEINAGNHSLRPDLHAQAQLQSCSGYEHIEVYPGVDDVKAVDAAFDNKSMKSRDDGFLDEIICSSVKMTDKAAEECCNFVEINERSNSENGTCYASANKITKDFMPVEQKVNVSQDKTLIPDMIPINSIMADSPINCKDDSKFSENQRIFGNLEGEKNHSEYHGSGKLCQLSPQSLEVDNLIRSIRLAGLDDFSNTETEDSSQVRCGKSSHTAPESSCTDHSSNVGPAVLKVENDQCREQTVASLCTLNSDETHGRDAGKLLLSHCCSNHESKSHLDSVVKMQEHMVEPANFEPKACLEHPMPVLVMKVHVQDNHCRCLVLCGFPNTKRRVLFVYRITRKGFSVSLLKSINLTITHCECDVPYLELLESNGICFTPDGQELVVLGTFSIQQASVISNAGGSKKMMCIHSVKFVSYTDSEISVHTEFSSFGRHVYSLLIYDADMVFAGGENGFVCGWKMDPLWRNYKESFILPVSQDCRLSHVIQLLAVTTCPSLLVGCDNRSLMAIWNISNHQLLQILTISNISPLEVHILSLEVMNPQEKANHEIEADCVKLSKGGVNISVSLLLGVVHHSSPTSLGSQAISRTWMLEFFSSPSCVSVSILDHEQQRISAMNIMDKLGVAGTEDGHVYIWDTANGSIRRMYKELEGVPIACIASNWACDIVAVADMNARVMIYMRCDRTHRCNGP